MGFLYDKSLALVFYSLIGLMGGLLPTLTVILKNKNPSFAPRFFKLTIPKKDWLWPAVFALATLIYSVYTPFATTRVLLFLLITSISAGFYQSRFHLRYSTAVFVGLLLSLSLLWWKTDQPTYLSLVAYSVISISCLWVLRPRAEGSPKHRPLQTFGLAAIGIIFLVIISTLSFGTGIFRNSEAFVVAWHHWGAYIGPSELLLSGAKFFRDFPAQYGLGPTALIASTCGTNCWNGMHSIVALSSLFYTIFIAILAFGQKNVKNSLKALTLFISLFVCFFWSGYPENVTLGITTPSVGGLRFFPVLLLVASLTLLESQSWKSFKHLKWCGHFFWAIAALWSPESMFYATFIWWPYYLFVCVSRAAGDANVRLIAGLKAITTLLGVLVFVIFCFLASYWLIYKTTPTAYGYFAYLLNPPGPLPINFKGDVWYAIAILCLGSYASWYHYRLGQPGLIQVSGDEIRFRRSFLFTLLAYGAFSYYLGRSHDNNILNLLPMFALILFETRRSVPDDFVQGLCSGALVSLVALVLFFGWGPWKDVIQSKALFEFGSKDFIDRFSYENPATVKLVSDRFQRYGIKTGDQHDAMRAISSIRKNYHEAVTVFDPSMVLPSTNSGDVWCAIHSPANFPYIPSAQRQIFLKNTANSLRLAGWLVVDKKFPAEEWLIDFESVYSRQQTLDFGSYYAIRFTPLDH